MNTTFKFFGPDYAIPVGTPVFLAPKDQCAGCPHPHAEGSAWCWVDMPEAERTARIEEDLKRNSQFQARLYLITQDAEVRAGRPARVRQPGAGTGGVKALNQDRRNGAKVIYPGCPHEVPTIYTAQKCYPYPNWKRKLGLLPSYLTSECKVIYQGWLPGQKPTT